MQNLADFWALVVDVWRNGFAGIDIGKFVGALLILAAFILVRGILTKLFEGRLRAMARRTTNKLDDAMVDALVLPFKLVPVTMGIFFAAQFLDVQDIYADLANNLVRSLIAFAIFWALYRLVTPLSFVLTRLESVFTHELVEWLIKSVRIAIALVGTATVIQTWGIAIGPIIAGAGLFGIALALGAQDLFKNLISGILILGEKRFRKGDWIKAEGTVEGTVESIGFRSTIVRRFDKAPVHVPNSELSDNAVTNFSAMTHRRIYWIIGVEYRTTVDQLRQIRDAIERYVLDNDEYAHPPEVSTFVRIDRFSDSSIDIMLYCFTRTTDWGEWLRIKEDLAYRIKDIIEQAGTGFAFPSQSIYVETLPSERPEIFVAPGSAD